METDGDGGLTDADYAARKRSDRIYVSRPFKIGIERTKDARYISRVFDESERNRFDAVDGEIVLRATHGDKVQVKAVVTSDDHNVRQLTLQSFRIYKDGARPNERYGINLKGSEIDQLLEFVEVARKLEVTARGRLKIDREALDHIDLDLDEAAKKWLIDNPDALRELVSSQMTTRDVVAVTYRRRQLDAFHRLLHDNEHFDKLVSSRFGGREESLWQAFFEKNRWIFGYGIFHLSIEGFSQKKLEQLVAGATVATAGKRIDGLLRTRGRVSSTCLVEIKRHRTALLEKDKYRSGAWQASKEVTGAIAQALMSVDGMEQQFSRMLVVKDEDGNPTGESAVIARPRSVVVCGSLSEFVSDNGVNEDKFRSFELFRRSLIAPDIITFDELFERARLIVEDSENV
ncbi:MAG: DUF4263 domain-containing protein [Xanthomonadaceae bacterium]|nr:DUF4263 domain-containing protein [Xanthomonadaceae bacterium]